MKELAIKILKRAKRAHPPTEKQLYARGDAPYKLVWDGFEFTYRRENDRGDIYEYVYVSYEDPEDGSIELYADGKFLHPGVEDKVRTALGEIEELSARIFADRKESEKMREARDKDREARILRRLTK